MQKSSIPTFLTLLILTILYANTIHVVAQETHDIMVVSVTPSSTEVQVGDLINITVVVSNHGTGNETFDLTVFYDTNAIKTKPVLDLAPDMNSTLIFPWNITDVNTGVYTIKAEADHLLEETITEDNTLISPFRVRVSASPYIAVFPGSTVDEAITPGMNFTVSVYTDYSGSDVWGYELELAFTSNILEGIEVVNGDLITEDEGTTMWFPGTFNNAAGTLSLTGNAFLPPLPPAPVPVTSGPGTLINITFKVVGRGDSFIELGDETRLIGYDTIMEENFNIIDDLTPSPGHLLDSYFSNQQEITHDIAIISVTPSSTEVQVGDLVNITVTVENQGTVNEDITIEVYRDYTLARLLIGTKNIENLQAGAVESLAFTWDTTGSQLGNHTLTALTDPSFLPGETDTADNILESDEMVDVRAPEEQPIPIDLIIGIVVIVLIAIAVVYVYRRLRKH